MKVKSKIIDKNYDTKDMHGTGYHLQVQEGFRTEVQASLVVL